MIKGIIFDCFGVIYCDQSHLAFAKFTDDSTKNNNLNEVLRAHDIGIISEAERDEQVARTLGVTTSVWRTVFDSVSSCDEELLEYIVELKQSYKTALLSNMGAASLEHYFTPNNIIKYFDAVVLSGQVGYAKPDERIYRLAAERLDLSTDECVFIDDRESFTQAAEQTGMRGITYTGLHDLRAELSKILEIE